MKADWRKVEIGTLGKVITGKTPSTKEEKYFDGEFPFVSPKDLNANAKYVGSTGMTITQLAIEKFPNQVLPKNSILFTSLSYGFGKMGVTRETCLTNQQIHSIVVDESKYDFHFIYYAIRHNTPTIRSYDSGVVTPIVPKSTFCKIKIDIPSLPTQQKIASILSAYDDLIENNIKRIELLEEQAQLIYEEWFVRMKFPNHENTKIDAETGLPEGWTNTTLAEVAKINLSSITSSFDENIKYIDIASVSTKSIDYTTEYPIKEAPGRAKRIVTHGDVIWSCVRPNRKSYAVIWKPEDNTIASTGFSVITPIDIPTSFLYQVLGTEQFIAYLTNRATGAAYPAVKSIDFKEYDISLPSKPLIDKFDAHTKYYLDMIWNLKQQNKKLKEARNILLPRLMMGIIEV